MPHKSLWLSMVTVYQMKENDQNGCHLTTIGQNDQICNVHILGYRCISVSNMKFLFLILWLGEVCTDTNADADNAQNMIVQGSLALCQMSQKSHQTIII